MRIVFLLSVNTLEWQIGSVFCCRTKATWNLHMRKNWKEQTMAQKPNLIKSGQIRTDILFDILDDEIASSVNGFATALELTDSLLDDAEEEKKLDEKAIIKQMKAILKWGDQIKNASGQLIAFESGLKEMEFDQGFSKQNNNLNPKSLVKWIRKTAADLDKEEAEINKITEKVFFLIDSQKKKNKKDEFLLRNIRQSLLDGIKALDRINTNLFDQKVGLAELAGIDDQVQKDDEMMVKAEFGSSLFDDDFNEPPKERSSPRLAFLENEKKVLPKNLPGIALDVLKVVNVAEDDLKNLEKMIEKLTSKNSKGEKEAHDMLQEAGETYGLWALKLDETKEYLTLLEEELAKRALQNATGDPEESMDFVLQTKNVKKVRETLDSVATSLDKMTEKISELIGKSKPSGAISLKFLAILKKPNIHWLGQLMGTKTILTLLEKDLKEIL